MSQTHDKEEILEEEVEAQAEQEADLYEEQEDIIEEQVE